MLQATKVLHTINSSQELKQLEQSQLPLLADELREFILQSVANS